ncbi:tetratricopeptide repeat protein [Roseivirga sp. BDSF3-8]|uniref:tetratricopeptide repeat protein n=1 Tax=Roseivirga sp. BDSF3-8 TaxID=3241598 RepID=UPI003531994B
MKKFLPAIFFLLLVIIACEKEDIELPSETNNVYHTVDRFIQQARDLYKEQPEDAEHIALKALELSKKNFYLKGEKNSHNVLYWIYLKGNVDQQKAEYHLKAYEATSNRMDKLNDLGALNYSKGYHLYKTGEFTSALAYLLEAYDIYLVDNKPNKAGHALYTIALIFYKNDLPDQGIRYAKKIEIDSLAAPMQINTLQLLGMLHYEAAHYDEAIVAYSEAISVAETAGDKLAGARIKRALSLSLMEAEQFDEAKEVIQQGLQVAAEIEHSQNLTGELLLNEAYLYEKMDQPGLGIRSINKAIPLFEETGNFALLAQANQALSHNHFTLKNYEEAKDFALKGLRYKDEARANTLIDLYTNLSTYCRELGDETGYYKYAHEALKVDHAALQSSQKLGLQKAELSYRNDSEIRDLEADIITHEAYMSQSRNIRWAIIGGIVLTLAVLFILLLNYGPIRHYERRVDKAHSLGLNIMEQLDKIMKAMSLKSEKVSPPEGPDETDLHGRANKGDQD